jgi:competence protein ComGD
MEIRVNKGVLNNERGFTLLEMLIVLTITMVICSVLLIISQEKLIKKINYQIMNQNELVFRMAQMKTVEEGDPYVFEVLNRTQVNVRHQLSGKSIYSNQLPDNVLLYVSAPYSQVRFKTNGNLQAFGSMSYHFDDVSYSYSINIGKGRIVLRNVVYD